MKLYTTAPAVYDYEYVTVLAENVATTGGKPIRLVEIPADRADYQRGRYWSGMHYAEPEHDYKRGVALGVIVETPGDRVDYHRRKFDLLPLASKSKEVRRPVLDLITGDDPCLVKQFSMYEYVLTVKGDRARFDELCRLIETAIGATGIDLEALAYMDAMTD